MDDIKPKKKLVQDIVPAHRSIRNVGIPSRRERITPDSSAVAFSDIKPKKVSPLGRSVGIKIEKEEIKIPPKSNKVEVEKYAFEYEDRPKSSKKILYGAILLFVIALVFGISALFKSAIVGVTPKNEIVTFDEKFTAKKDNNNGGLAFQTVVLSKDMEKTVSATSEQKVSRKATGQIMVYNNYSVEPQKLLINTRFQTLEGLIFKSVGAINIPGKTAIAGSVLVDVYADAPGDKYNVGLKDFTIPGFKSDPRFSKIYARSKTPMSGGFEGMQKVVEGGVLKATEAELEAKVKEYLSREILSQIPANFVLYTGSISYVYSAITQATEPGAENSAVLRKKGTAIAIIFDKGSLSRAIISKALASMTVDMVKISNLESFEFSYPTDSTFESNTSNTLDFTLKGDAKFEWIFDENKLKSDLLGLSDDKARIVISNYKSIKESWIKIQPIWNKIIPNDPNKVKLVNTLSQ